MGKNDTFGGTVTFGGGGSFTFGGTYSTVNTATTTSTNASLDGTATSDTASISSFMSDSDRPRKVSTEPMDSCGNTISTIGEWRFPRRFCHKICESGWFAWVILLIILLNTVLLVIQTDSELSENYGFYLSIIDNVFLGIYTFEFILKLITYRTSFFKSGWNNFDAIIVVTSFLDWTQYFAISTISLDGFDPKIFRLLRVFKTVRALRALRALRTLSFLKNLQMIVSTIIKSISALGAISILVFIVIYIFAIIGRTLFAAYLPARFGSFGDAVMSLLQLITLDDWFDFVDDLRPYSGVAIPYLLAYILLQTFILINLFSAVIVDNLEASLQKMTAAREERKRKRRKKKLAKAATQRLKETEQHMTLSLGGSRASLSGSFGGSDLEATEKETADVTQRLEDTKAKITGEAAGITGPETPSKAAKKKMSIHDVEKEAEKELRKKEKLASSLGGTSSVSG
ncbi:Cation channel sperm-associated protein 1 like protein, partial [Aduncisulcus paluster]